MSRSLRILPFPLVRPRFPIVDLRPFELCTRLRPREAAHIPATDLLERYMELPPRGVRYSVLTSVGLAECESAVAYLIKYFSNDIDAVFSEAIEESQESGPADAPWVVRNTPYPPIARQLRLWRPSPMLENLFQPVLPSENEESGPELAGKVPPQRFSLPRLFEWLGELGATPPRALRMLDAGCGMGRNSIFFVEQVLKFTAQGSASVQSDPLETLSITRTPSRPEVSVDAVDKRKDIIAFAERFVARYEVANHVNTIRADVVAHLQRECHRLTEAAAAAALRESTGQSGVGTGSEACLQDFQSQDALQCSGRASELSSDLNTTNTSSDTSTATPAATTPAQSSPHGGYRVVLFARFMEKGLLSEARTRLVPALHSHHPSLLLIETFHATAAHPAAPEQKIVEGECMRLIAGSYGLSAAAGEGVVEKGVESVNDRSNEQAIDGKGMAAAAPGTRACVSNAEGEIEKRVTGLAGSAAEPPSRHNFVKQAGSSADPCAVCGNPAMLSTMTHLPTLSGCWEQLCEDLGQTDDGRALLQVVLRYTPRF
eukprot:m.67113 g.67113  ORF g.67113 m.67113 type:complete len:544 (-) comp12689_c0_seq1:175-1806(-)